MILNELRLFKINYIKRYIYGSVMKLKYVP